MCTQKTFHVQPWLIVLVKFTFFIARFYVHRLRFEGLLKMAVGTTPPPKVKPIRPFKWKELTDNAKLAFYFKLSKTSLTAFVAISGVTEI